jgi:hypothetical protein
MSVRRAISRMVGSTSKRLPMNRERPRARKMPKARVNADLLMSFSSPGWWPGTWRCWARAMAR